jgi:hypothetical protein
MIDVFEAEGIAPPRDIFEEEAQPPRDVFAEEGLIPQPDHVGGVTAMTPPDPAFVQGPPQSPTVNDQWNAAANFQPGPRPSPSPHWDLKHPRSRA